jgi:hypothetical protein
VGDLCQGGELPTKLSHLGTSPDGAQKVELVVQELPKDGYPALLLVPRPRALATILRKERFVEVPAHLFMRADRRLYDPTEKIVPRFLELSGRLENGLPRPRGDGHDCVLP